MSTELKNYEVIVTGSATVLVVSAKDESEAILLASKCVSLGSLHREKPSISREIRTFEELEVCRLHADFVYE